MSRFVPPIELHQELNPKLWNHDELHPDVQLALLRISREFYRFLEVDAPIEDIVITGSQANYNYTEKSDIDLHLIVDMSSIQCDEPIEELFDAKRRLWKEQHTIDIHGVPVEAYVEDTSKPAVTASYSLLKDSWINHPSEPQSSYNVDEVRRLVNVWHKVITSAITVGDLTALVKVKTLLVQYRRLGLKSGGEFGVANLVFKSLRNDSSIDALADCIRRLEDQNLSLE